MSPSRKNLCLILVLPNKADLSELQLREASQLPVAVTVACTTTIGSTGCHHLSIVNGKQGNLYLLEVSAGSSFGDFLRCAASRLEAVESNSDDVLIVDGRRFDLTKSFAALEEAHRDHPDAGIIAATSFSDHPDERNDSGYPDLGASRIARTIWDEAVPDLAESETEYVCGVHFGIRCRKQSKSVVPVRIEMVKAASANESRKAILPRPPVQTGWSARGNDHGCGPEAPGLQASEENRSLSELSARLHSLSSQLTQKDRRLEHLSNSLADLSIQLSHKDAALSELSNKIENLNSSIGGRLLTRYGRIKYRYLMPLYRVCGLVAGKAGLLHARRRSYWRLPPSLVSTAPKDDFQRITIYPEARQSELAGILQSKTATEPLHRSDIICFSIIDWWFRFQRPQQIMAQFARRGHRVFYINLSEVLNPRKERRIRIKEIGPNLYDLRLAARRPPDVYSEVVEGGNADSLLESFEQFRRVCNINEAIGYVMISSWTEIAMAAKRKWGWRIIYDCMDEWENFPGIQQHLLESEKRLAREADLLIVTAQRLVDKWKAFDRHPVLARNAADYDFFERNVRPNQLLEDIQHPVVGYYGAIAQWFDVDLLAEIARLRPNYTFVLLGGVFDVDLSPLTHLPNVRVLGQQPYETMPQYLYHFDVCIIPFKRNSTTDATDPVKVYEYLSAGKPVVSVALPELEPYREFLYLADGAPDFLSKLDRAVNEKDADSIQRRKDMARQNTWNTRYDLIYAGIVARVPPATIVIVTYNNLALTKLCIQSVIRNTGYPGYEIVIVDNASSDGTRDYLERMAAQHGNIQIILNQTNRGFAAANNQGIDRSLGSYIVLLNNDTIVPPGWLSRLVRHLDDCEVGLVGPRTNFVGNEAIVDVPYRTWGEMETFTREHTWRFDGKIADIHMLAMFCVAFRRDVYEAVGRLDERFGIGMFEDDDYSQRVRAAGYRVVCAADVFVHHFGQAAFKELIKAGEYDPLFETNRRLYEAKWNTRWVPHTRGVLDFADHLTE